MTTARLHTTDLHMAYRFLEFVSLSLFFAFLPAGMLAQDAANAGSPVPELLYGVLDGGGRQFRFVIQVEEKPSGSAAELQSLDEGRQSFKLDAFRKTEQLLEFEIKASSARYSGQFDESSKAYVGRWKQRGADLGLDFQEVKAVPTPKLTAVWSGQLNVLWQKLDLQFRELESGEVFFDSLSQKAGGFLVDKTGNGKEVTYDVQGIPGGAKFTGTLSEDGSVLTGKWRQGLLPINLVLEKQDEPIELADTKEPQVTMRRPQTPQPPFPYSVSDVSFDNKKSDITLAGTLTIPSGQGPFPAVVLISGSGPQDRDESILGHKPFWGIADHFSRNGIAVLRFDDRGTGESGGDFAQATSQDFALDVVSAVSFLRQRDKIDSKAIGLCGHSEGGIIAPIVANQDPDLAFVILMAGPGVSGEKVLASQARLILEASGIAAAAVDRQREIQALFLQLAKQTPPLSREELVEKAQTELADLVDGTEVSEESLRAMATAAATQLASPWLRYFLTYDPAAALQKMRCPVLALIGEKDIQVDPKLNIPALQAALDKAPTSDVTVRELPGLNHLFQHCTTGMVSEYAQIEETISPEVLNLMADWILQR